jgi:eukaryotic-like serine/threonine-protein kinase
MSEQTVPQQAEFIGRYRIVSEIGRGAMGIVYRGEDEALGRSVAIKTILASMDDEEQAGYLARFKQEAKALGGLNHPSIVTVYEFGDQNGVAYFAMEYLRGEELRSVISKKQLDLATAVELVAQIAEGLAFAHSHGIVHRDIKPGNIWVVEGKRAKIMDFGIARVRTSDVKTQTGLMLGSPKYMSPEQVLGNPVDNRSDIFSLGVVLHEMLTGTPPFAADDVPALMYQVCNAHPAPPSAKNLGITRTLDLIVARALEKEPAARYQDAGAMAWDLRASLPELTTGTPGEVSALVAAPMAPSPPPAAAQQPTAGTAGLHVSSRFDSTAALERLTKPHGEDRRALSPAAGPAPIPQRWLADGPLMAALALIAGAAAAAWFIATH